MPADTCRGALAADEAGKFFGGAELEFSGHTAEWVGEDTEYCAASARGDGDGADGVRLDLNICPSAAHRASGAAESASATPIGFGWNGSVVVSDQVQVGVLVDCAPLHGDGLLVLAETRQDVRELSDAQVLQVARFATESARRAAKRFTCEGALGQRPSAVDRTPVRTRPVAKAEGTCRDIADPQDADRLGLTTVSERQAGRALTEACTVELPAKDHHGSLTAYYGPSAQQEMYLGRRYPGSVPGAVTRSHHCDGALWDAYFKFEELPRPDSEKRLRSTVADKDAKRLLASFATASGARHGCPVP
uniref:Septum formation-related domain-containing protein n=1 Tax=Streptomyces sp. NBC_01401 TaxID=2903854 RepID=A0AAU3H3Q8_9ACTN